ncbi:MAG: LytTR family DNA-binding domain-containing protein [Prolixibacteraceae bacterium]|jgi:two-component system LytT family response regulator|nr:LytTR family DNA-binding domain-containing protein [Prolixibacteraceae bacterium]
MDKFINCLVVDDEPVAREIIESHLARITTFRLAGSCKNAMEAFKLISSTNIDLIFLDINMPEISGLSFAKSINKNLKVIFTTAYREYALDGFDLQAVDYLLKPISFERFLQAVNKYLDETTHIKKSMSEDSPEERSTFFFVRSDRKMVKINFADIQFIESISDYIKIHLTNKAVVTRETISNIEAKLPQADFIRTHRSFIVALSKIESFNNETIDIDQREIPISRSYKEEVLLKLDRHQQNI